MWWPMFLILSNQEAEAGQPGLQREFQNRQRNLVSNNNKQTKKKRREKRFKSTHSYKSYLIPF